MTTGSVGEERRNIGLLRRRFTAVEDPNPVLAHYHSLKLQRDYSWAKEEPIWFVSEKFDLLFVCGLAPWLLGVVAYLCTGGVIDHPAASVQHQMASLLFIAASLVIGESHQFTSIIRYYGAFKKRKNPYNFARLPMWFIYYGLLFAVFTMFAQNFRHANWFGLEMAIGWLITAGVSIFSTVAMAAAAFFPVVLMQHVCAQAKSIGLVYCRAQNFEIYPWEKRVLSLVTWLLVLAGSSTIALPFAVFGGVSEERFAFIPSALVAGATVAVVLLAVYFLSRGASQQRYLPRGAVWTWSNMALFLLLPFSHTMYFWLFVPVFFHATQHWAMAWRTRRLETTVRESEEMSERELVFKQLLKLVLPVQVLMVCVLFGPLILNRLFGGTDGGAGMTLGVELSMFVFYLHYFTDRIVWRPTN